jgi:hypothetical protein
MKKKVKAVVARTEGELAEILGLERADGIEFAVRSALNTKIIHPSPPCSIETPRTSRPT